MRRSLSSRLLAALLAAWFVLRIGAEPAGMSAGAMGSMNMSGKTASAVAASASISSGAMADMPAHDMTAHGEAGKAGDSSSELANGETPPANDDESCKQHDCCCSALSPSLLVPPASLAWIPEHLIEQAIQQDGDRIAHSEGQLLLPFANGPPVASLA